MAYALGNVLLFLLDVCFWIIIIQVVLSWLIMFEVINIRNPQAANFVRQSPKSLDVSILEKLLHGHIFSRPASHERSAHAPHFWCQCVAGPEQSRHRGSSQFLVI